MTKEAVIFLFIAIVVEVIATISLKLSDSFTRLVPSLVTIIGYCIAFWCLTIPMRTIPMRTIPAGIIYAIWSGVGIVLIGLIGWLFLGQKLDVPAIIGMLLIICGVIVINLFSKSVSH
ncbi:QacE family quaternary ammonium compound efflux SMR transporter [Salmonella enterica subsp. enterica]|nr:QacE family quaternary ammonium compound efflux SMR transporter [Salmonella enterica subsp. enterica serovar Paratyphi A]ECG0922052.1 QacE family quaternary ammonium compound efflux SMR transporter [Salmonella enterica subsp. enterica serovar Paratyphi A]